MVLSKLDLSARGRRLLGLSGLAAGLLAVLPAAAQYPGQVAKSTKDAPELRAISVLEWTGEAGKPKACRIVPVAVLDGGKLQDGGIYLSRPEPIALAGEVEYELQQNGQTIGLFDIENSGHEQGSWVGYGKWKPKPVEKPKPTAAELARSMNPDEEDSDKPVLHRKKHPGDAPDEAKDGRDSTQPAAAEDPDRPKLHKKDSADSDASGSKADADPDHPVLHKKDASQDAGDKASSKDENAGAPSDPDRPMLKKTKKKEPEDVAHVNSVAGATDPDRPTLKRGLPTGYKLNVVPSLMGLPMEMQQAVAVSDAKPHPDHPWTFSWANPEDEVKMKTELEGIARTALGLDPPAAPVPASRRPIARRSAKAAVPAVAPIPAPLTDEQFRVFELSFNSGATLVLSAQTDGSVAPRKFVTLVAQPDLYGELRVVLKSVTDTGQLDENPRMILVDAVDALADNRGELLFELRGASQRQFALYRVLRGQAEKLFVTMGGEYGTEVVQ